MRRRNSAHFRLRKKCRSSYCGKPFFEVTFRWTVIGGAERRKIEWRLRRILSLTYSAISGLIRDPSIFEIVICPNRMLEYGYDTFLNCVKKRGGIIMDWEEILSDYNKAKDALWSHKGNGNWHREEEIGYYYMWNAYYKACKSEPKDYLLFARILAMMADERRFSISDYDCYHKYVKPSVEAYDLAEKAGQHPTEKELNKIRWWADSLAYELNSENAPCEEQIKLINGYEQLDDFGFHDSKPVWFEHTEKTARLKLNYYGIIVTFLFEGVLDIHVDGDPLTNWIGDFHCYPGFRNKEIYTFDVEYYKILCSSISVEKIERIDISENEEKMQ